SSFHPALPRRTSANASSVTSSTRATSASPSAAEMNQLWCGWRYTPCAAHAAAKTRLRSKERSSATKVMNGIAGGPLQRTAGAGEVGLHPDVLARAAEVKPEAGAHVVQDEDGPQAVRTLPQPGEEPGRRHLLVVEDVVPERAHHDGRHVPRVGGERRIDAAQVGVA